MIKVINISVNNDTSNPINVEVSLSAEKENGLWSWSIDEVKSVELVVGDKEGIDITSKIKSNVRALALITSQAADEQDQIVEALTENQYNKAS